MRPENENAMSPWKVGDVIEILDDTDWKGAPHLKGTLAVCIGPDPNEPYLIGFNVISSNGYKRPWGPDVWGDIRLGLDSKELQQGKWQDRLRVVIHGK
jgi:hypothetical protein